MDFQEEMMLLRKEFEGKVKTLIQAHGVPSDSAVVSTSFFNTEGSGLPQDATYAFMTGAAFVEKFNALDTEMQETVLERLQFFSGDSIHFSCPSHPNVTPSKNIMH